MHDPFRQEVIERLATCCGLGTALTTSLLETPPDWRKADYAFPCFRLAKERKTSPAAVAAELAQALGDTIDRCGLSRVEAQGPYLNFFVDRIAYAQYVLAHEDRLIPSFYGVGKTVLVDFSSPNIAKPLAFHHLRSAAIGNSLCRIHHALGYRVIGINFLGDWGTQFGKLIVACRRSGGDIPNSIEALNERYVAFHRELEKKPELEEEARRVFRELEDGDPVTQAAWARIRAISLAEFNKIYELMGIQFDVVTGESEYHRNDALVVDLLNKGIAVESDGAIVIEVGDDIPPCMLRKDDGATLYATRDIAAALDRWNQYQFEKLLYVVDAGQSLHFQQVFRALKKIGCHWVDRAQHVPFGVVRFGGSKTSTRQGKGVLLQDVFNEAIALIKEKIVGREERLGDIDNTARQIGVGAVVFADLGKGRIKDVDFVWDDVLNFQGKTGPYIQYSYTRARSILRKAETLPSRYDVALLKLDEEWALVKLIARVADQTLRAATDNEPSHLAQALIDLCQTFHGYHTLGGQNREYRVLGDDAAVTAARLALVHTYTRMMKRGLELLGLEAPEQM